MIPINEQIKALQISLKGISKELENDKMFPPVKRELARRGQCIEDAIKTLKLLSPLLKEYEELDRKVNP